MYFAREKYIILPALFSYLSNAIKSIYATLNIRMRKINYCFSICNALTTEIWQRLVVRPPINQHFCRNIAQINVLYTKQTLIIYLGYLGILSFGKLGLLSLSPSFILLRIALRVTLIPMREIDFYLAPQICAGTASTQSLQIHRTRPRQPRYVRQLQQNSPRSFPSYLFSVFFLSLFFQLLCVERRNKSSQSREVRV